VHIYLNLHTFP